MRKKKEAEVETKPEAVKEPEPAVRVTSTTAVSHTYKKFEIERVSTNGGAADITLRHKPEFERCIPTYQAFHVHFASPAEFVGFAQWVNRVADNFLENATEIGAELANHQRRLARLGRRGWQ